MVNHNVRVTFAVRIADGVATGIWASSVLSTYINVLEGDNDQANEKVGYAQAIQGTFLAAAAIPAGWLAINYRRDSILKVMGFVAFAAIATTSAALLLDVPYKYALLCCGLALWGVAQANAPVLDALFADSVPTGTRSKLYTWLHMSYIVAQGLGPGVGALMFALNGNVWKLKVLERVMLVGMALAVVPALLMLCFDDDQALGAESEGLLGVTLLQDDERRLADEEAATSADPDDPGGDYRRPFLDGWCSDEESAYRNQVSPAISPARPVLPLPAPAASSAAAAPSCRYGPPLPLSPPRGLQGGGLPPLLTPPPAASPTREPSAAVAMPITPPSAADASALVASHAVALSPMTMSPASTDRSGWATPAGGPALSPPPGRRADGGGGEGGGWGGEGSAGEGPSGRGGGADPGALLAAVEAAAAEANGGPGRGAGETTHEGEEGSTYNMSEAASASRAAERFHAVRQAVDGASAGLPSSGWGPPQPSLVDCRSVSIAGGVVPSLDSPGRVAGAAGLGSTTIGEGEEAGGGGGGGSGVRTSGDSAPSELSFSSMLPPGSGRGHSSRATSNGGTSAPGSTRDRTSAGGAGGGGGGPPSLLQTYPEEDSAAEPEVSDDPSTPTLQPRGGWDGSKAAGGPVDRQSGAGAGNGAPGAGSQWAGGRKSSEETAAGAGAPVRLLPAPIAAAAAAAASAAAKSRWSSRGIGGGSGGGAAGGTGRSGGGFGPGMGSRAVGVPEPPPLLHPRREAGGGRGGVGGAPLQDRRFLCLTVAWIPGVLALTDCIMGLASGMTIKFFPIFFKDAVQLQPMYVNLMYCAIPLCLSSAAFLAQRESRVLGRVQTMVMNRGIGISLLYWIATHTERWHQPRLMVPIYVLRTSIMNSIYPLQKSVLMDFVPKERRAAWNSLESVTSFGWSGSAALGGWLIHKFGFRTTFLITATMQCMGWCMSMLLLPLVPRKELPAVQGAGGRKGGARTGARGASGAGLGRAAGRAAARGYSRT